MHSTMTSFPEPPPRGVGVRLATLAMTVGLAVGVVVTGAIIPSAPSGAATRHRTVVMFKTTGSLGRVLVDGSGHVLYIDTRDRLNHVSCTGKCAKLWPPLLLAGGAERAVAGTGVTGLGTVPRAKHRLQVTWHKKPLYRYVGDRHPGQARGQGKGGIFFAASTTGSTHVVPGVGTTTTTAPPAAGMQPATGGATTTPPTSRTATGGSGPDPVRRFTGPGPPVPPGGSRRPVLHPPAPRPPAPRRPRRRRPAVGSPTDPRPGIGPRTMIRSGPSSVVKGEGVSQCA